MISIITGDIVNSRGHIQSNNWLEVLKTALSRFGKEPLKWEIYRGDSFQLEITEPEKALLTAIYIKACIKTFKNIDVRMAIGIGNKDFVSEKITEANGEAFVFSGEKFETLKKERQTLAIQTNNQELNQALNVYLKLALIAMDNWSTASAEFVKTMIENEKLSQQEIGEILGISQSSVSERYSRAYFSEILDLNSQYIYLIKKLIHKK